MNHHRILIAGIGNIFFGDDAFGCEVARRLLQRTWPDGVRVVDFGIRGIDLAYALQDGYDLTILIDATPRGGQPGTLYVLEIETSLSDDDNRPVPSLETHGMDPAKVLRLVDSLGGVGGRVLLIGCEPTPLESAEDFVDGLSPPVAAAVDHAIAQIQTLVAKTTSGVAPEALIEEMVS